MKNKKAHGKKPAGLCIFPGYKWCGPGCRGPGRPINGVDGCCRIHDLCYMQYGASCKCDRELLRCLRSKVSLRTKQGRQAAVIYSYMKIQKGLRCAFGK